MKPRKDITSPKPSKSQKPKKVKDLKSQNDWLNALFLVSVLFIFIRFGLTFFVTTTTVTGHSMDYTLYPGQELLVYSKRTPKRYDLIAFDATLADPLKDNNEHYYIKRVLGLPGDTLEKRQDGLYINGQRVYEGYLSNENAQDPNTWTLDEIIQNPRWSGPTSLTVPDGYFFVLGDNRGASEDSRTFGYVPNEAVLGVAKPLPWDSIE